MSIKKFLRWAGSSLIGHLVLFQIVWLGPMYVMFLALIYSEGTLTFGWALYMAIVMIVAGLAVAILGWFTVSLPLMKRRQKQQSASAQQVHRDNPSS